MKRKNFPHRKAARREAALARARIWLETLVSWRDQGWRMKAGDLERAISITAATIRNTERNLHRG